jgi:predicted phage terminase large subunit-like protein
MFTAASSTATGYRLGWWHVELGRELDRFAADSLAGKGPRLIVVAPPRHGKTELVGPGLICALMARAPGLPVIYATHRQGMADKVSLRIRRRMVDHLAGQFPHLQRGDKWTSDWWETAGGNSLRAVGVGVGTAGEGARVAVVDDPFGSREDAYSAAERERVWGWFLMDIESRIMNGGGVLVMHTRWHESDLAGRLQREQPGVWRVLHWPALAEHDEPQRKAGAPLVPHLFGRARLEELRSRLTTEQGSAAWSALYQGRPLPQTGGMFQRAWYEKRYRTPPMELAATCDEVWLSLDAAGKGEAGSDFCALHVWGRRGADCYLLDRDTRRMNAPELDEAMAALVAKWGPHLTGVLVEDAALGMSYYQRHRGTVAGLCLFRPSDTPGRAKGKEARALALVGPSEAGQIHLPDAAIMPGIGELVDCWCIFPAGANDDDVDAASQVFLRWRGRMVDESEWGGVSAVV